MSNAAQRTRAREKDWIWLVAAGAATILMWQFPTGRYLLYPFTILGTWFHEMGHGLTALLLGGNFTSLQIFPNGSGIATHTGAVLFGGFGQALVAAGGPMGPPLAGAILIVSSTRAGLAKYSLMLLGGILILSVAIWIRTALGAAVILLLGLATFLLSLRAPGRLQILAIQFLGVQACISTFRDFNYLFTAGGEIAGEQFASDTMVMARYLLLPHWIWALILAFFSTLILVKSLRFAYRGAADFSRKPGRQNGE